MTTMEESEIVAVESDDEDTIDYDIEAVSSTSSDSTMSIEAISANFEDERTLSVLENSTSGANLNELAQEGRGDEEQPAGKEQEEAFEIVLEQLSLINIDTSCNSIQELGLRTNAHLPAGAEREQAQQQQRAAVDANQREESAPSARDSTPVSGDFSRNAAPPEEVLEQEREIEAAEACAPANGSEPAKQEEEECRQEETRSHLQASHCAGVEPARVEFKPQDVAHCEPGLADSGLSAPSTELPMPGTVEPQSCEQSHQLDTRKQAKQEEPIETSGQNNAETSAEVLDVEPVSMAPLLLLNSLEHQLVDESTGHEQLSTAPVGDQVGGQHQLCEESSLSSAHKDDSTQVTDAVVTTVAVDSVGPATLTKADYVDAEQSSVSSAQKLDSIVGLEIVCAEEAPQPYSEADLTRAAEEDAQTVHKSASPVHSVVDISVEAPRSVLMHDEDPLESALEPAERLASEGELSLDFAAAQLSWPVLVEEDDLEREFDEEPEFTSRQIVVKRNKSPRAEYELGAELGRGKFGTVYKCTELATGRQLAAKFVTIRRAEDLEDVEREVAIMCQLQHRRLLQLYDAFDDCQSEWCLITELVEGGELFERIVDDDFDLTERKAAVFMRQICEGVEYMHEKQIVHLDMKPENILCLSREGNRIKLIDFGLARRLSGDEPLRVMFGTPDFAAPEVLTYEFVSFATDMWSVGVICYVLLSGLSPFMGDNDLETMANVTRATFDFDDKAFDLISELAKDFIARLLVREPHKRLKPAECLRHAWLQRGGPPPPALLCGAQAQTDSPSLIQHSSSATTFESNALLMESADLSACLQAAADATPQRPRASFGAESTSSGLAISLDKRRLKRYVVRRKWHKTVHAIMALGRMGANLKLKL